MVDSRDSAAESIEDRIGRVLAENPSASQPVVPSGTTSLERLAAEISQSYDIELTSGFLYVFDSPSDRRLCIWIDDYDGRPAFWWRHMGRLGPICPDGDSAWATDVIRAYLDTLNAHPVHSAGSAA